MLELSNKSEKRIELTGASRDLLFESLQKAGYVAADLASLIGVHSRTVRDWRRGKYLIPKSSFIKLLSLTSVAAEQVVFSEVSPRDLKSFAGRIGGVSFVQKYGYIGTDESRRKGGVASYLARRGHSNDIFARKIISTPELSVELAEFVGIMIGDGSIAEYQVTVALDAVSDRDYSTYVVELAHTLFGIAASIQYRKESRCLVVVLSSIELVEFLVSIGLRKGHKLRQGLDIPDWIANDENYAVACVRGIFDTDGSVYEETHQRQSGVYRYPRLALVSASPALRTTVTDFLQSIGICAKIRQNRSVSIERFTDIEKYFRIVGSSNVKHQLRYAQFGGVG